MKRFLLLIFTIIFPFFAPAYAQESNKYEGKVIDDIHFHTAVNEQGVAEELKLDIYLPEESFAKPAPVMLWFHGGGFRPGNDKKQRYIVDVCREYATKGYVCISADYRIRERPRDDFQGTVEDAMKDATEALKWIVENSKTYNMDITRFYLGGGSAGGFLSVNLAARYPTLLKAEKENIPQKIDGYICLWGAQTPEQLFSPLTTDFPPTLFIHGSEDKSVSVDNAISLDKALKILGIPSTLFIIEGAGHTPMAHRKEYIEQIDIFLNSTK